MRPGTKSVACLQFVDNSLTSMRYFPSRMLVSSFILEGIHMARSVSRHPRILLITALLLIAVTLFALLHGLSLLVPDRCQKAAEETPVFHGSNREPEPDASRISVPYISQENLLPT